MNFVRHPDLLTHGLRKVIQRDSIIFIGILIPLAGLIDTTWDTVLSLEQKKIVFIIVFFLTCSSLLRLRAGSILDKKPYIAVITYTLLLIPGTAYFADIRSFYIFSWVIPLIIAHFYYGSRFYYTIIGVFLINQIIKATFIGEFEPLDSEDYLYIISEFFIVLGMTRLIIDAQRVSSEDRKVLLASLQRAEFEEKRVSELVNSLSDAVLAVDTEGIITKHNATARALLDTHDDLDHHNLDPLLLLENDFSEPIAISRLLVHTTKSNTTKSYSLILKSGKKLSVNLSIIPIKTSGTQSVSGYLIVIRDITKEKTVEQEQRTFMSLLSHELRTPVTISEGSLSNIELVAKASDVHLPLLPSIADAHKQIVDLGQKLNKMDAFITASQPIHKESLEPVNLDDLLTDIINEHSDSLQTKNLKIERKGESSLNLITSRQRLRSIIDELLANAIKYTNEGLVTVILDQSESQTIITIRDTGIGIAPEKINKLFRPFHQTENFETRSDIGAGLGLYIAQEMAQSINGRITTESIVGSGSNFTLTINS